MSPRPRKSLEAHQLNRTTPEWTNLSTSVHAGSLPKAPKFLSGDARKKFKGLVKQLAARRTVTSGDADLLAIYASTWERWQASLEKIRLEGPVVAYSRLNNRGEEVQTEKPNLHMAIAQDAERSMVSILTRLGLTPKDRESVRPTSPPLEPVRSPEAGTDEWARAELAADRNPFATDAPEVPASPLIDEELEKVMEEL